LRAATQATPSATAAAVSRFDGSAMILHVGKFLSNSRTPFSWSTFVRTTTRAGGINPSKRATVSSSSERLETRRSNCFGKARRLSGQNLSPLPPARINA
jgi:hypothetical protein